jgi:hypothetical protein
MQLKQDLDISMETSYIIFDVSELPSIDFNEVSETSIDTVMKSVDEQKAFVKYDGDMPNCIISLRTKEGPYTNDQMIEIIETKEWTKPFF